MSNKTAEEVFEEALRTVSGRTVLPTTLRTWLLSRVPAEIRARAFFSAGVAVTSWLENWHRLVEDVVAGRLDRATARLRMKEQLARDSYAPIEGDEGSLLDLRSDERANLIIDTNVAQANGWGRWIQEQDPDLLDAYPCRELYRAIRVRVERPWRVKWTAAGGKLYRPHGRMIARVDDPIWTKPIDQGGFNRFGTPFAPFDFNSGMRTRPILREEAEALGVIPAGAPAPQPQADWPLNRGTQSRMPGVSSSLRSALERSGAGRWDGDVFVPLGRGNTD